jgi:hypothetical protein
MTTAGIYGTIGESDCRGLLKVLTPDAELRGSPNVIFIPMSASMVFRDTSACRI